MTLIGGVVDGYGTEPMGSFTFTGTYSMDRSLKFAKKLGHYEHVDECTGSWEMIKRDSGALSVLLSGTSSGYTQGTFKILLTPIDQNAATALWKRMDSDNDKEVEAQPSDPLLKWPSKTCPSGAHLFSPLSTAGRSYSCCWCKKQIARGKYVHTCPCGYGLCIDCHSLSALNSAILQLQLGEGTIMRSRVAVSTFGPPLEIEPSQRWVLANPPDASRALVGANAGAYKGSIVVARRGGVSFYLKALEAQRAGATALVICNNSPDCMDTQIAGADDAKTAISIGVAMLPLTQGQALLDALERNHFVRGSYFDEWASPLGKIPGTMVRRCLEIGRCTFAASGSVRFEAQPRFSCSSCGMGGVCASCIQHCHKEHKVAEEEAWTDRTVFFCECGWKGRSTGRCSCVEDKRAEGGFCPSNHSLTSNSISRHVRACDECWSFLAGGRGFRACELCCYVLCARCDEVLMGAAERRLEAEAAARQDRRNAQDKCEAAFGSEQTRLADQGYFTCAESHPMKLETTVEQQECDECESLIDVGFRAHHCAACSYNLCLTCAQEQVTVFLLLRFRGVRDGETAVEVRIRELALTGPGGADLTSHLTNEHAKTAASGEWSGSGMDWPAEGDAGVELTLEFDDNIIPMSLQSYSFRKCGDKKNAFDPTAWQLLRRNRGKWEVLDDRRDVLPPEEEPWTYPRCEVSSAVENKMVILETKKIQGHKTEAISRKGVSWDFLNDFLVTHPEVQAQNMSTDQVVTKIIIPLTSASKLSYAGFKMTQRFAKMYPEQAPRADEPPEQVFARICAPLAADPASPDGVKRATHFVSHTWKRPFMALIEGLRVHQAQVESTEGIVPSDCVYWIDIFVIQQHGDADLGAFEVVIADCKKTVLMVDPWNNPTPLTRAWCLYEIFQTMQKQGQLIVGLNSSNRASLLQSYRSSAKDAELQVEQAIDQIDAEKADAFKSEDKAMIFGLIQTAGGFTMFNKHVKKRLTQTLIEFLHLLVLESKLSPVSFLPTKNMLASRWLPGSRTDLVGLMEQQLTAKKQKQDRSRLTVLVGETASGKSVLAAHLVNALPGRVQAYTFFQRELPVRSQIRTSVCSIVFQLAIALPWWRRRLLRSLEQFAATSYDDFLLFNALIAWPFNTEDEAEKGQPSYKKPIGIVLDGLDETLAAGPELLYFMLQATFPTRFHVLLTVRPWTGSNPMSFDQALAAFTARGAEVLRMSEHPFSSSEFKQLLPSSVAALPPGGSLLAARVLARLAAIWGDAWAAEVVESLERKRKTQGEEENEEKRKEAFLFALYEIALTRGVENNAVGRQASELILVAKEPLSVQSLAQLLQINSASILTSLKTLAPLFQRTDSPDPEQALVVVFHSSVHAFCATRASLLTSLDLQPRPRAVRRICDAAQRLLASAFSADSTKYDPKQLQVPQVHVLRDTVSAAEVTESWDGSLLRYLIRFGAQHLLELNDEAGALELLLHLQHVEQRAALGKAALVQFVSELSALESAVPASSSSSTATTAILQDFARFVMIELESLVAQPLRVWPAALHAGEGVVATSARAMRQWWDPRLAFNGYEAERPDLSATPPTALRQVLMGSTVSDSGCCWSQTVPSSLVFAPHRGGWLTRLSAVSGAYRSICAPAKVAVLLGGSLEQLAMVSENDELQLVDGTGNVLRAQWGEKKKQSERSGVDRMAASPDGKLVAVHCKADKRIVVYHVADGTILSELSKATDVDVLVFSSDNKHLSWVADEKLIVAEVAQLKKKKALAITGVRRLAWDPSDAGTIAVATWTSEEEAVVRLCDSYSGAVRRGARRPGECVGFRSDGKLCVSAVSGYIEFWAPNEMQKTLSRVDVSQLFREFETGGLHFSSDGRWLCVSSYEKAALLDVAAALVVIAPSQHGRNEEKVPSATETKTIPSGAMCLAGHVLSLPTRCYADVPSGKTCGKLHVLQPFTTPSSVYSCNGCAKNLEEGAAVYSCRACDWDICNKCYKKTEETPVVQSNLTCRAGHLLISGANYSVYRGMARCDLCKLTAMPMYMFSCTPCKSDLCKDCYQNGGFVSADTAGAASLNCDVCNRVVQVEMGHYCSLCPSLVCRTCMSQGGFNGAVPSHLDSVYARTNTSSVLLARRGGEKYTGGQLVLAPFSQKSPSPVIVLEDLKVSGARGEITEDGAWAAYSLDEASNCLIRVVQVATGQITKLQGAGKDMSNTPQRFHLKTVTQGDDAGRVVLACTENRDHCGLSAWELPSESASWREMWTLPSQRDVGCMAWTYDGCVLATTLHNWGCEVTLWDGRTGKAIIKLPRLWKMDSGKLSFNSEGSELKVQARDGRSIVWKAMRRPSRDRPSQSWTWSAAVCAFLQQYEGLTTEISSLSKHDELAPPPPLHSTTTILCHLHS
eukprot:gb/GEZN01000060.1/.p1 GENE.gb/GEZN01000060.1/~~gb/GEZN01000060.1/.p1  ORF type:complete len:2782 (+),score=362.50 gb/GEZN01000060.1/:1218-8348(+)